jgi:xylose isomerase
MDLCAQGLLMAEKMITDDRLDQLLRDRYAGWKGEFGQQVLAGKLSLDAVAAQVLDRNLDTTPQSGRQEFLEYLVNRY